MEKAKCNKCGKDNMFNAKYCMYCGYELPAIELLQPIVIENEKSIKKRYLE